MICFVILHYIATEETTVCVDSILNNVNGKKHIIIVDNNSPNNSGEILSDFYSNVDEVTVLKNNKNDGFARGNNIGYRYALENFNPDFIVIMNNDMEILQKDFIKKIYENFEKERFSVLGPDIFSTKGNFHQNPERLIPINKEDIENQKKKYGFRVKYPYTIKIRIGIKSLMEKTKIGQKYLDNRNKRYIENKIKGNNHTKKINNCVLHGSCLIFSKLYFENNKVAFYDKTFMYTESHILHYICQKENYKMVYSPELKVMHHEDISTNKAFNSNYKKELFVDKCLYESALAFIDLMNKYEK